MNRQNGMATLLISSVLLIVALIFSLAAYKNVFYQIKRTQNEVLSRQAHWISEGGLECGYSALKIKGNVSAAEPVINTACEYNTLGKESLALSINLVGNDYEMTAQSMVDKKAESNISKLVGFTRVKTGVFQATSDLVLDYSGGNINVYPEPGDKKNGGYNCIIARFANNLEVKGTLNNGGLDPNFLPYEDFVVEPDADTPNPPTPNSYAQKCNDGSLANPADPSSITEDHWTESVKDTNYLFNPTAFNKDFQQIAKLDPFDNVFGSPREKWQTAKKELGFVDAAGGASCAVNIANKIKADKKFIWIKGNCDLSTNTHEITAATSSKGPAIVVVQDGVVGYFGAAVGLDLLFYQFLAPTVTPLWAPKMTDWDDIVANVKAEVILQPDSDKYIHYHAGSLQMLGGFIFDMPGYKAQVRGSSNIGFNGNIARDLLGKPNWVQGSWHDF